MRKKNNTWILVPLLLVALVIVPMVSEADIGNSGQIVKDLPASIENLTINASNADIRLKVAAEGQAPHAEMDATVFGIHSADVTYGIDVNETDGSCVIDIHHNGKDFGINDVDVNIYVSGPLKNLSLDLDNCDLDMKDIYAQISTGRLMNSEIDGDSIEISSLTMTLERSDLDLKGIVEGVDLTTYGSEIDIRTSIVPEGLVINGSDSEVELRIPKSFSLEYDVKTGYLHTNAINEYHEREGTIHFGEGGPLFTVKLDGGGLDVKENK